MLKETKAAIVLCAGTGSRMQLPDGINKCAAPIGNTSAAAHTISVLLSCKINRIVVVTGYARQSVYDAIEKYRSNPVLCFADNEYYNYHGCNYSLACGMLSFTDLPDRLLIIEGDSLHHPDSVKLMADTYSVSASLIRERKYIDYTRSVIAVGTDDKITRYHYNQNHERTPPQLASNESILGESMQIWSLAGNALSKLHSLLATYKEAAGTGGRAMLHSGVYSLNMLNTPISAITSAYPDDWINLNTQDDFDKAGDISWLQR